MSSDPHPVSNHVPRAVPAFLGAMMLATTVQPAYAVSSYLTAFETQYPAAAGTRIDSCDVCHTSVPALNPYGQAFQDAGHEFGPIEALDSDGDTFSNLTEIMALTFPGDPGDTPPSPSPTVTATAAAATPTTTATGTGNPTDTPTVVTTGTPPVSPTNTGGIPTTAPTTPSGAPTNTPQTGVTTTPIQGSPTVSRTASPTRIATGGGGGDEDDGCSIGAPERSSVGFAFLLTPAMLLWLRRRRL